MAERGRAELGKADLVERDVREIEHLRSSGLMLPVHTLLEVLLRRGRDALFRPGQEVRSACRRSPPPWGRPRCTPAAVLRQAMVEAELALDDRGVPLVPLELRHLERAGHLAVAAADAAC